MPFNDNIGKNYVLLYILTTIFGEEPDLFKD